MNRRGSPREGNGPGPRHELFVYVENPDDSTETANGAGAQVLKPPALMPWGGRLAYLQDPEGNLVTLARAN
ncbi:VOC family protein [Agromyces laixinhei]|uniref:VOC family protein n=1 Tax=Agromyces laixinhei TaxID=2585717 RepID=UPI0012EE1082|nr:VOC family protein [Agromyces laixinhei]